MNTDTLIILIAMVTLFVSTIGIVVALHLNQSKKIDVLKDEIINLKLDTNNQITELKLSIKDTNYKMESGFKDINTNLYLINERLDILGFSNKHINSVHSSKEQELDY